MCAWMGRLPSGADIKRRHTPDGTGTRDVKAQVTARRVSERDGSTATIQLPLLVLKD